VGSHSKESSRAIEASPKKTTGIMGSFLVGGLALVRDTVLVARMVRELLVAEGNRDALV
jgi:hypothetical protein